VRPEYPILAAIIVAAIIALTRYGAIT